MTDRTSKLDAVEIQVQPRRPEDDSAIRGLLESAELPFEDLSPELLERFLVARASGGAVVGVVGLEVFGRFGLLRSLVVHPAQRGSGLGALLVEHLERRARTAGVTELFLLTTTAAAFFTARGYRTLARTGVPAEVAASREFQSLCPATAVCQGKRLAERGPGP